MRSAPRVEDETRSQHRLHTPPGRRRPGSSPATCGAARRRARRRRAELGNSFDYLTPADTARSLAQLRRALRAGGRLLLESGTEAESLLVNGLQPRSEHEFGGVRMTKENRHCAAESRVETNYVLADADGVVEHARAAYHVHRTGEVVRLLRGAGFADVVLLDADGTSPYTRGSRRLVAVATA